MATDNLNSTNAHILNHISSVDMSTTLTINQAGTGEPLRIESNTEAWKTMFVSNDAGSSISFDNRIRFAQIAENQNEVDDIIQQNRKLSSAELAKDLYTHRALTTDADQFVTSPWTVDSEKSIRLNVVNGANYEFLRTKHKYDNVIAQVRVRSLYRQHNAWSVVQNQQISVDQTARGNLGAGAFTIEFWMLYTGGGPRVIQKREPNGSSAGTWGINVNANMISFTDMSVGEAVMAAANINPKSFQNIWNHVAVVRRNNGGQLQFAIYINGIRQGNFVNDGVGRNYTNNFNLTIGFAPRGEGAACSVSNLRISNVALYENLFFDVPQAPLPQLGSTTFLALQGNAPLTEITNPATTFTAGPNTTTSVQKLMYGGVAANPAGQATVVIAAYTDPITRITHTLSLVRGLTTGGVGLNTVNSTVSNIRWGLVYNVGHFTGREFNDQTWIINDSSALVNAINNNVNWDNLNDGCLIRVVRIGNQFTCSTTNFLTNNVFVAGADITFNLADDARLAKFATPCSLGVGNMAQRPLSFVFEELRDISPFYNIFTNDTYTWNNVNNSWILLPNTPITQDFPIGTFVHDQYTEKTYLVSSEGTRSQFRAPVSMRQNPATGLIDIAPGTDLIMTSPNGTRYAVRVDNNGNVTTTAI